MTADVVTGPDQPAPSRLGRIVIIGGGQAAGAVARTLRAEGFEGSIAILCAEAHRPYERPPLSKAILLGTAAPDSSALLSEAACTELSLDLHLGVTATAIDRPRKRVVLATGDSVGYDRLVIATGGRARRLRVPGGDLEEVVYLRTLDDSLALGSRLRKAKHLLVVGGGWIGLEVASSARALGLKVTVLEADARLCGRGAPPVLSDFLLDLHRRNGVEVRLGATLASLERRPGGGVAGILANGETVGADLALIGIGIVPNDELARDAGLACENGVACDALGRTADDSIFACGDVATFIHPAWSERPMRIESWANAQQQGAACARAVLGKDARYDEVPWFWSDQFEVNIQLLGAPDPDVAPIRRGDSDRFSLFWLREGHLAAAVSVGVPRDMMAARRLAAGGPALSPDQLRDPAVDLRKLLRAPA